MLIFALLRYCINRRNNPRFDISPTQSTNFNQSVQLIIYKFNFIPHAPLEVAKGYHVGYHFSMMNP